jgi:hypothetical protein
MRPAYRNRGDRQLQFVIPAQAGIQRRQVKSLVLDARFRGHGAGIEWA